MIFILWITMACLIYLRTSDISINKLDDIVLSLFWSGVIVLFIDWIIFIVSK